jgi:hypothetical protein
MADQKFLNIANNVVVSRSVFAQLYDQLIAPDIPRTQQFMTLAILRDQRQPNLTGPAKDQADFAEAFEAADNANLLYLFFAQHAAQLFGEKAESSLQSLTNFNEPFQGGLKVTLGGIEALRRTCRITCKAANGDEEKGSGFLVGPHLVLTNWHVVRSLLDAQGNSVEDSHLSMTLEFDYLTLPDGKLEKTVPYHPAVPAKGPGGVQAPRWLVACSEAHPHETGGRLESENWPAQPDELYQKLDFAVIELDGMPGYDRGYYDLAKAAWPVAGNAFTLGQFPLGLDMKLMPGTFVAPTVFSDNKKPARFLHTVNTTKGSSGGLCLDLGARAVGLHQAGKKFKDSKDQNGNPVQIATLNAAIPLPLIAALAGAKVKERIAAAPRIVRSGPNNVPIVGRRNFQALVDEAIRGNIRILTVQTSFDSDTLGPRTKIGKSFSTTILRALLPPAAHIVFSVEATRLTSDAYKAARLIVETVNNSSIGKLPKPVDGQAALDAAATTALVDSVVDAMRSAAGDSSLWLVIDDLDRNRIASESTTNTFLTALYKVAANEKRLRIVLIGLLQDLPALTGLAIGADSVMDHVSDSDVEEWISAELAPRMPVLRPVARLFVAIARSVAEAGIKEHGRTGAIADVLKMHLGPKLRVNS